MGRLKADYARSYYDIWKDVIKFIFFRARHSPSLVPPKILENPDRLGNTPWKERRLTLTRMAGIIQSALGGQVEKNSWAPETLLSAAHNRFDFCSRPEPVGSLNMQT